MDHRLEPVDFVVLLLAYTNWSLGITDNPAPSIRKLELAGYLDPYKGITNAGRARVESCLGKHSRDTCPQHAGLHVPGTCETGCKKPGVPRKMAGMEYGTYCDECWHTITK